MKRSAVFMLILLAASLMAGAQEILTPASFYADADQSVREGLAASRVLQSKGQWSKAWNLLTLLDPENKNGYVLAEKIRLALEGNVANGMLISFSFVDVPDGKSLEDLRLDPPEDQKPADFNPLDLTQELEKSGEAIPPVLSYELGNYLYQVYKEYGEDWIQDSQTVQQKAVENYDRALAYDTYTSKSLSNQAELLSNLQQYEGAEKVLRKAIAVYPEDAAFSVRLAGALNSMQRFEEVYPIVDEIIAKNAADDTTYNAFIEGIKAGLNSENEQKMDSYVNAMIERYPAEYIPFLIRHLIAVRMGQPEKADAAADEVTEKFGADPNVVRSLLSTWLNAQDVESGFGYLDRSIEKFAGNDKALSGLYFYRALMHAETAQVLDDIKSALEDLDKAESYFSAVYDSDNMVFETVKQLREEWNQIIKANEAEQEAPADATSASSEYEEAPAQEGTDATSGATN